MRCILTLLLLLPVASVTAQTPVFKIEDNTGTVLLLVKDDGTITLPTGATNGYVLTTDANGNATWMPASGSGGSLTLPFAGTASSASPAFSVENTGTGRGLESTAQGTALWASSAVSEGLRVSSAGTRGVFVVQSSAEAFGAQFVGGDGVNIFRAGSPSATNSSTFNNGFEVSGAEGYGLFVGQADLGGINIASAGQDGVRVITAGSPSAVGFSFANDGFEIRGAEGHGLFVGHADDDGVHVQSATQDGVSVASAGIHGVSVGSTGGHGVSVGSTGGHGVSVGSASGDGVHVNSAGNPTTTTNNTLQNGFEVSGAEGHGLFVGRADEDGVHVASAGNRAGFFNGDVEINGDLEITQTLNCTGCVSSEDIQNESLTGSDIQDGSLSALKLSNGAGGAGVGGNQDLGLLRDQDLVVRSLTLNVPSSGLLIAWASANIHQASDNQAHVTCSLTSGTILDTSHAYRSCVQSISGNDSCDVYNVYAATRAFPVASAGAFTVNLVCREEFANAEIEDSYLTGLFVPNQY